MDDPTTFSYYVLKAVQERIKLMEDAVLDGSPKEFTEYRELVGEIRGLRFCETEIRELLRKSEEE